MGSKSPRIFVAGQVAIETPTCRLDEPQFGGGQVRLLFVLLILERHRPHSPEELADALWPAAQPASWEAALRGLLSRVRTLFATNGLGSAQSLAYSVGCYHV